MAWVSSCTRIWAPPDESCWPERQHRVGGDRLHGVANGKVWHALSLSEVPRTGPAGSSTGMTSTSQGTPATWPHSRDPLTYPCHDAELTAINTWFLNFKDVHAIDEDPARKNVGRVEIFPRRCDQRLSAPRRSALSMGFTLSCTTVPRTVLSKQCLAAITTWRCCAPSGVITTWRPGVLDRKAARLRQGVQDERPTLL